MTGNQTIDFKDLLWITAWLDTALEKEKEKYEKCPVIPDMVPGHEAAQGWGYVCTEYFLLEEAFLPIRLTPMTATCRVPPLSRVKLGIGWSRGVARDAEQ